MGPVLEPRNAIASPLLNRPNWLRTEARQSDALWLDKNENLDPQLQVTIRAVMSKIDPLSLSAYPELGKFYRRLAEVVGVRPEHLILSAGSDGAIRYVFEAYVAPGDWVLHTAPTFAMYPVYSSMYGARSMLLEYEPSNRGPVLPVEKVTDALRRVAPKVLFLPNPDSPTGTVFSPEELTQLLSVALETATTVLVDEAYYPFYPNSCVGQLAAFPNLIIARTFAKAWGLAGLRIGYAISNERTIRFLNKVRPMYEVSTFAVEFMEHMLSHEAEVLASVKRLNEGKGFFLSEMENLGLRTLRNEGNFLHVSFGAHAEKIFKALDGVVLFRQDFSERSHAGLSRFSTTTQAVFEPVVQRIRQVIQRGGLET